MKSTNLGYRIPFILMAVLGIFMAVQYYIPHPAVQHPKEIMLQWKQPLNAFIIFLALGGLAWVHIKKVVERKRRWGYSALTLASMVAMILLGMVFGTGDKTVFSDWFEYLITPIEATMFATLAFFVASAAFRAFKARSESATILLVSGFVVMMGLIPVVSDELPIIGRIADFVLKYPNTAAKRAIVIGVSLGAISVALKTLVGIDKTILRRDQ